MLEDILVLADMQVDSEVVESIVLDSSEVVLQGVSVGEVVAVTINKFSGFKSR